MTVPSPKPGRATCERCRRPLVVCYCAHLPHLPTRTRVLLLQHPRERDVGIGTARMAHLSLPKTLLRVGVDFAADPVVTSVLEEGAPPHLLFPGGGARDLRELPLKLEQISTLVVLDGTWSQARKLLRMNPRLATLPRIAFQPSRPSDYRIRRQPAALCVSTIEALAEVLGILEPDGGPFERLLDPFRAMVDRQQRFETEVQSGRHRRHARSAKKTPRGPTLAMRLAAAWPRLVCLQGEANNWPVQEPGRPLPELVHFVACRPATGALFEAVVAPRCSLAPMTPQHLQLSEARLHGGVSVERWRRSWLEFARPDDVLVQWGTYHATLAAAEGLALAPEFFDLRAEMVRSLERRVGTVEACLRLIGAPPTPLALDGRAGARLAALVGLVHALGATAID